MSAIAVLHITETSGTARFYGRVEWHAHLFSAPFPSFHIPTSSGDCRLAKNHGNHAADSQRPQVIFLLLFAIKNNVVDGGAVRKVLDFLPHFDAEVQVHVQIL